MAFKLVNFFVLVAILLCFVHAIVDLKKSCPQPIYPQIYTVTSKYFVNKWTTAHQNVPSTTESLYYVWSNSTHSLVTGVCYRFSDHDYLNSDRTVPKYISDEIKKACVTGPCQSGHLIPALLGGSDEPFNFVPQYGSLNGGQWKVAENFVADRDPNSTLVYISLTYDFKRIFVMAPNPKKMNFKINNLYYSQPVFMNMVAISDDEKYHTPLLYMCGKFDNSMNKNDTWSKAQNASTLVTKAKCLSF